MDLNKSHSREQESQHDGVSIETLLCDWCNSMPRVSYFPRPLSLRDGGMMEDPGF